MEGKVIAITGAASGIGLALAHILVGRGAKVSIIDVDQDNLDKASEDLKKLAKDRSNVISQRCDVRDFMQVESWLKSTVDTFGRLDGAANMAAVFRPVTFDKLSLEDWDWTIGVNLTGMMHCIKAQLPLIAQAGGGSIVNGASTAGIRGFPGSSAYGASKHGVVGLTRVAAKEGGPSGMRVNAIAPGWVDTPMVSNAIAEQRLPQEVMDMLISTQPIARMCIPTEVAEFILFMLRDQSKYMNGTVQVIDGGATS